MKKEDLFLIDRTISTNKKISMEQEVIDSLEDLINILWLDNM